jgi:hypothetical protein
MKEKIYIYFDDNINPNPEANYLSLNIDEKSCLICLDSILNAAQYYDLSKEEALKIINDIRKIVRENYRNLAIKNGLSENNISYMKEAFRFCEEI